MCVFHLPCRGVLRPRGIPGTIECVLTPPVFAMSPVKVQQLTFNPGELSHSARSRTINYSGDFPDRFGPLQHARDWCDGSLVYYNHGHRHSAIGRTPRSACTSAPLTWSASSELSSRARRARRAPNDSAAGHAHQPFRPPCGPTNPDSRQKLRNRTHGTRMSHLT